MISIEMIKLIVKQKISKVQQFFNEHEAGGYTASFKNTLLYGILNLKI